MLKKLFIIFCFVFHLHADEIDLSKYETSLYSQNGEDGILAKLFQLAPPISKFCVELGAYDGVSDSNTYLLRLQRWNALLLDKMKENHNHNLFKEFITAENVNQLFEKYQVPQNFDLLSIDLDYNDFYIWKALDPKYQPTIVLIEYNAAHLPHEDKVVKYRPYYAGGNPHYYGASILALYNLGRAKGYSLIYAEEEGMNLFFMRDEMIEKNGLQFKDINNVEKLYRASRKINIAVEESEHQTLPYFSSTELGN